ncbi:MAG TPA: sigma-70 family RNA polymerase sigma factor [Opitutaceae bacterium]|nr:sigma-70 family RNA polymerase sigma factor [Opitutaceae bacterium]
MTGDSELLRRYIDEGSQEAFAELARRHIDFVYAVALRHARSPHRAEDAAQAVFTDLARKARVLAGRTELVGWLFVSARYAALKLVRGEALRAAREAQAGMSQRDESASANEINWSELQPLLDDALQQLGESDRSAVLLRCVKGFSFAEVGSALALSEEAARKRTDRALDQLRRSLNRRGLASSAEALGAALAGQSAVAAPSGLAASVCGAAMSAGGKMSVLTATLHLMSTSKITAAAALVAGVLAIGTAFHETQAAILAQGGLAAARADAESVERRLTLARERGRIDEAEAARMAAAYAAGPHAPADAGQTEASPGTPGAARRGMHLGAAADDDAKAAALRQAGEDYIRNGARLGILSSGKFLKHPLTPAQVDALVDIQASDFNVTINGVPVPGNPPENQEKGIRAIVGLVGLQTAKDLRAEHLAAPYQTMTAELAGNVAADGPLDPAAADQLTAVLQQNRVDSQPDAWPAALTAAARVLSPEQEGVLRTYATSKTGISYPEGAAR